MVKSKYHRRLFNMAKKKEVYKVKPLNENKKNIISALIEELVLCQEKVQIKYNQFSLFM